MNTIDFCRSFVTFRIDSLKKPPQTVTQKPPFSLNNARVQIECRCEITERKTGRVEAFVLGASCKTEQVGVEHNIWNEPNADFMPIASVETFLSLKTFERADKKLPLYPPSLGMQPEMQIVKVAEALDSLRIDIGWCEGEVLETPKQIVETVLANVPLVARTEIQDSRYVAILEYPVKTMNANERDMIYQTDTGPILLPDLSREPDDLIAGMRLAFAAFNCSTWIEFIIRTRTPVAEGVEVHHYRETLRLDCLNQVIRLKR